MRQTGSNRGVGSEGVDSRLHSLFLAFIRASLLRKEYAKADRRYTKVIKERTQSEPNPVDAVPVLTFFSLWLGALQVVVEGYCRSFKYPNSFLCDPSIDALLAQPRKAALEKFRHSVFHPETNHPDVLAVISDRHGFTVWADELMVAFQQLLNEQLHTGGKGAA